MTYDGRYIESVTGLEAKKQGELIRFFARLPLIEQVEIYEKKRIVFKNKISQNQLNKDLKTENDFAVFLIAILGIHEIYAARSDRRATDREVLLKELQLEKKIDHFKKNNEGKSAIKGGIIRDRFGEINTMLNKELSYRQVSKYIHDHWHLKISSSYIQISFEREKKRREIEKYNTELILKLIKEKDPI